MTILHGMPERPAAATHWDPSPGLWMAQDTDGGWSVWRNGAWYPTQPCAPAVSRFVTVIAPWDDRVLPPVGTVCEVAYSGSWERCEIIAHFRQRAAMVAAFTVDTADGAKILDAYGSEYFRPLRTPEQIAAEEREKAVDEMLRRFALTGWPDVDWRGLFEQMHDAGYRKQEELP